MMIYGHRQLSCFFVKVLDVTEDGFTFKEKFYTWNDIKVIDVTRGSFVLSALVFPGGTPRVKVKLADGKVININGRALERVDKKPKINKFSGESDAFLELISLLEKNTSPDIQFGIKMWNE
ncbi:MAG: hypothetical protein M0T70_02580 [Geobacteraceae bacterium]|nr:hypothetical protein [Geobacteraceae bacterium]